MTCEVAYFSPWRSTREAEKRAGVQRGGQGHREEGRGAEKRAGVQWGGQGCSGEGRGTEKRAGAQQGEHRRLGRGPKWPELLRTMP